MRLSRHFLIAVLFSSFFAVPAFAASFESSVEAGILKENSIETDHFHIEFSDLILAQTDSDGDNISDIIETVAESAESSWDKVIDEMNYDPPQEMTTGIMLILDDNYEYLSYGALGITGLLSNGNPYIALDPWVSEEILIVTTGHEFFHAVQFGYDPNFAYTYQGINWAEATSTWIEDVIFDAVNDYIYYLPDYLDYPDYSIFASVVPTGTLFEYGMCIWPRFLSEYYDDSVIKDVWENYFNSSTDYDSDLKVYEAVVDALQDQGDDLVSVYKEFVLWNLSLDKYEEGDTYPSVYFIPDLVTYEYTQIQEEYAPALFGSNYLYFPNTDGEKNFYFHIIKPADNAFSVALVPYESGSFEIDAAVSVDVDQNEEMDTYLSIGNLSPDAGVVAVVSHLGLTFEDGYNWGVFDAGYVYEYLAGFDNSSKTFSELMSSGEEEIPEDKEVEVKEGEDVEASDGKSEETLTLSLIEYDSDSASFSWNRLDDDEIAGYELRYEADSFSDEKEIGNVFTTFATVDDLKVGATYTFQLFSLDADGDAVSDPSSKISVTPKEWIFEDISYQHEYFSSIDALVDIGIFQGYGDDTFRPNDKINRAELLKILVEGRGINVDGSQYQNCFSDVHEEWFAKYICYAKDRGWVQGYSDASFRPGNAVNKVEALKMLFKVYQAGLTEGAAVAKLSYSDLDTKAWYAIYVWKASMLGILEESFGKEFNPSSSRTRGEMAEELYRYLVVIEKL